MITMFCTNCGKPVPDGSRFCPYCGAPVAGSADGPSYEDVLKKVNAQKEEKIYMITNPNKKEIAYAILDIKNNTFIEHKDIKSFDYSAQKILTDTDAMVNLTKKHSQELKNILKFLPQKWRKW